MAFAAKLMKETQDAHVANYPHRYVPVTVQAAEEILRKKLAGNSQFVVAVDEETALGYAIFDFVDVVNSPDTPLLRDRRFCYLWHIGVDPDVRRQGVGRTLVQHVISSANEAGIEEIELKVWAFNESARRFFQEAGFEAFATRMRTRR